MPPYNLPAVIFCLRQSPADGDGPDPPQSLRDAAPSAPVPVVQNGGSTQGCAANPPCQAAGPEHTPVLLAERAVNVAPAGSPPQGEVILQLPRTQQSRQGGYRIAGNCLPASGILHGHFQVTVPHRADIIQLIGAGLNHPGIHGVTILGDGDTGGGGGHPANQRGIPPGLPGRHVAVGAHCNPVKSEVSELLIAGPGFSDTQVAAQRADGSGEHRVPDGNVSTAIAAAGPAHVAVQHPATDVNRQRRAGIDAGPLSATMVHVTAVAQTKGINAVVPLAAVGFIDERVLRNAENQRLVAVVKIHAGVRTAGQLIAIFLPVVFCDIIIETHRHPDSFQPVG
ncbi:Uncharacterised protein [Shigella sonnei]|nr:Uncharacterised protein [Shigella sonnei]